MQLSKNDFSSGGYARSGGAMRYGLLYKDIASSIQEVGNGYLVPNDDILDKYNTTTKKLKGALWSAICGKQMVQVFKDIDDDLLCQVYTAKEGIIIRRI